MKLLVTNPTGLACRVGSVHQRHIEVKSNFDCPGAQAFPVASAELANWYARQIKAVIPAATFSLESGNQPAPAAALVDETPAPNGPQCAEQQQGTTAELTQDEQKQDAGAEVEQDKGEQQDKQAPVEEKPKPTRRAASKPKE